MANSTLEIIIQGDETTTSIGIGFNEEVVFPTEDGAKIVLQSTEEFYAFIATLYGLAQGVAEEQEDDMVTEGNA